MRGHARVWVVFVVLACVVYAASLAAAFQSDDYSILAAVRAGGPFGLWSGPGSTSPRFLRPVISLSLFLDQRIWGESPFGYHLTNIVFHGTNAFLVARIAAELLLTRAAALAAGLFFLLAPTHAESVAWIAGRTDVIAASFGLAAFLAYLVFRRTRSPVHAALALVCLAVGLLAKESLVGLPFVVLCHALLDEEKPVRWRATVIALFACAAAYVLVRRLAVGEWIGGYGATAHLAHNPTRIARSLLLDPLWALGLAAPGPHAPAIVATCVLASVVLFVALRARHGRLALFLAGAFFLSLLPALNMFVPFDGHDGERFVYFSSAFAALWLAHAMWSLRPRRSLAAAAAIAATILLAGRTVIWRQASLLCGRLVAGLAAQPHGDAIVVMNLPDDIEGAAVFRNGLGHALNVACGRKLPLHVVAHQHLRRVDDEVDWRVQDDTLALRSERADTFVYMYASPPDPDVVLVTEKTDTCLGARISGSFLGDLYVFTEGGLVPSLSRPSAPDGHR